MEAEASWEVARKLTKLSERGAGVWSGSREAAKLGVISWLI